MDLSYSLLLGCLWVLASAIVAMLPMRRQYAPGLLLLIAAPVLLGFIGYQHGWAWAAVGLFAFISMFRNPLRYLAKKALGMETNLPPEDGR